VTCVGAAGVDAATAGGADVGITASGVAVGADIDGLGAEVAVEDPSGTLQPATDTRATASRRNREVLIACLACPDSLQT
jgi:hypothetical protein